MPTPVRCVRRVVIMMGLATTLAATAGAQATGAGTTSAAGASGTAGGAAPMTMSDTAHTERDRGGFPWGLLGLLGLAGLMPKKRETVVHRETTARPGDPNYRI